MDGSFIICVAIFMSAGLLSAALRSMLVRLGNPPDGTIVGVGAEVIKVNFKPYYKEI